MHFIYKAAHDCVHPPVRKVRACLSCGCSSLPGKWLQSRQSKIIKITAEGWLHKRRCSFVPKRVPSW